MSLMNWEGSDDWGVSTGEIDCVWGWVGVRVPGWPLSLG